MAQYAAESQATDAARTLFQPKDTLRKINATIFVILALLSLAIALGTLLALLVDVFAEGLPWLNWNFLDSFDHRVPTRAGIKAALYGSIYVMVFTMLISVPLGVASAIYLEEYAPNNRFTQFIEVNISNLAGVPSIIYGLLGLQVFVRWLSLDRSVIAGALTLALLVLPTIIVAAREAVRAVPSSLRDAALAVGATKWQATYHHILPAALPGILTGTILAASRGIGETAPLITIGALTYIAFLPENIFDRFTVLPIQIFNWTSRPQEAFHQLAAAGIIVLLIVLLSLNSIAIALRLRLQRRY
jgi:phosphate transport system permease protein